HRARPLDALREHAVEVQHVVGQRANASKGGRPARLEVEQVLDRDGYTMQRSHFTTRANGLVCGRGCLSGVLEAFVDECVDGGITLLDALDGGLEDLQRRELSATDPAAQLCSGHPCDLFARSLVGCHDSALLHVCRVQTAPDDRIAAIESAE